MEVRLSGSFSNIALAFLCTACSTVSVPVLRHETGEAQGAGAVYVGGFVETSRAVPILPTTTAGVVLSESQPNKALRNIAVGLKGKYGLSSRIDLKLDTVLFTAGAGWRLGGKFQILGSPAANAGSGNFSVAVAAGIGRFASHGEVTYLTATKSELTYDQRFKVSSVEGSLPISYRLAENFAVYSGVHVFLLGVSGTLDLVEVDDSFTDFGGNLGFQFFLTPTLALNLELMAINMTDPFANTSGLQIFMGSSIGLQL